MEYLKETVIRDIVDLLGEIKDKDSEKLLMRVKKNPYSSSVAKMSKDLIMTYPVLCSNTLDVRTATMVSKAIERKCVTMLHIIFSSITVANADSAKEFITHYHQNIDMSKLTVDGMVKLSSELMGEFENFGESANMVRVEKEAELIIKEAMQTLYNSTPFEDSVNESSLQNYKVYNLHGIETVLEVDDLTTYANTYAKYATATKDISMATSNTIKDFSAKMMDNDAKKCNELVPSLLVVNFRSAEDDKIIDTAAIVGVKARLIPVDSFEIIDKIFVKHNDNNTILKLIRASTKEISFFKDFLFAVDKAKVDALSNSRKGSVNKMWKVLERRSKKSKLRKALHTENDATAITSLVVTQEEVNYLRNNYNINLESIRETKTMMTEYNLMCIAIVDESIEVVKFFFDGDDNYEALSFNSLERESGDGMYKKVITLMSKMNR